MEHKKIFAIDVGRVRIGIASVDDRGAVAPLDPLKRAQGGAEAALQALFNDGNGIKLVVGVPLDEKDRLTETSLDIFRFCRRLLRRLPSIELCFVDEYGTSLEAEAVVGNGRKARTAGSVDKIAAKLILERYLGQGADERISASFHAWLKAGINSQRSD